MVFPNILEITKAALNHVDNIESITRRSQKKLGNEESRETEERVSSWFPRVLSSLYSSSLLHYANMHF